jgi:prevent-host-death family protein
MDCEREDAMTHAISIAEAQLHLSELIDKVSEGEDVVITDEGVPIAQLIAYPKLNGPRQGGQWNGRVRIASDFDNLTEELEVAFGLRDERKKP